MSRESYARGFVKAASSMGVDAVELAKYAEGDVWGKVYRWLDDAKKWYGKQDAATKALIGAGGGALLGGTIGSIFNRGGAGALLGGIGGLASTVDWKKALGQNGNDISKEESDTMRNATGDKGNK